MCNGPRGIDFSNRCRSYLCQIADKYADICHIVVFSSLDVSFMKDEIIASGRPMNSVCTLPLLTFEQTLNILKAEVKCTFVNDEHISVDRDLYLGQLADVCGGHPTSIEYVVLACNTIIDGADRKSVSEVIRSASRLIGAYRQVDDHETLY
jgi:hypothetical protein